MLMGWAGKMVTPDQLAEKMFTPGKEGTFQMDLIGAVRREGFLGIPIKGFPALFAELKAGHPVLVFENLGLSWFPIWHYAVAIGYDLPTRKIVLHSDSDANKKVDLHRFERDWEGTEYWAAVVLPPQKLSASADEVDHLEAASALERVNKNQEAEIAYQTIRTRWPKSLGALVGLGNLRFSRGDARGAVEILRQAAVLYPQKAEVWHNLAVAYAGLPNPKQARRSAKKAVDLASATDIPFFRQSLKTLLN